MGKRDRANEGPTDKEWIEQANKQIADRGGKSRYVGTETMEDWTFDGDEHAADAAASPLDDIPQREQAAAATAEEQTKAELIARGLGDKYGLTATEEAIKHQDSHRSKPQSRMQALDRIIHYHAQVYGFAYDHHLDEWAKLTGTRHMEDKR